MPGTLGLPQGWGRRLRPDPAQPRGGAVTHLPDGASGLRSEPFGTLGARWDPDPGVPLGPFRGQTKGFGVLGKWESSGVWGWDPFGIGGEG